MIKKLLILSLLILSCYTATFSSDLNAQQPPSNHFILSACLSNDTDMAKTAILACQKSDLDNSSDCITQYIKANYSGQRWNAFTKNTQTNVDVVVFWYLNSCYVKLTQFGKFNRTFIIWPTRNYYNNTTAAGTPRPELNQQERIFTKNINSLKILQPSQFGMSSMRTQNSNQLTTQSFFDKSIIRVTATCPAWKTASVKNILTYCDVAGNDHAAECIMSRIKDEMNEYWDVYISTTLINSGMVSWYTQCALQIGQYGTFSRYIDMWRTY